MRIENFKKRENYEKYLLDDNFNFWDDENYWIEDEALILTYKEASDLVKASKEFHEMSKDLIEDIIKKGDYYKFETSSYLLNIEEIEKSWNDKSFSLFGRLDIGFKNGVPKILEYNADTPVTYMECSQIQERWYQDKKGSYEQFNSMKNEMLKRWDFFKKNNPNAFIHLMCNQNYIEEVDSANYMLALINQIGLSGKVIESENFFLEDNGDMFDKDNQKIEHLYKIIPWDFFWQENWGHLIGKKVNVIEPAWKALMNDKILFAYLWEKHPNHPYLLETVLEINSLNSSTKNFVIKPIDGKQGNNIKMFKDNALTSFTTGFYGASPMIYQERADDIKFGNHYYGVSSWIVGDTPVAFGARRDLLEIITNNSSFLSHLIE